MTYETHMTHTMTHTHPRADTSVGQCDCSETASCWRNQPTSLSIPFTITIHFSARKLIKKRICILQEGKEGGTWFLYLPVILNGVNPGVVDIR